MGKDKKIILAMTQDMKIYECFVKNLEFLGYEVVLLKAFCERELSKLDKKINSLLKLFSKSLKSKRIQQLKQKHHLGLMQKIQAENVALSLVIRPDLFEDELLKKLKTISLQTIAYQWDGLSRFPSVKQKIHWFDKFFVFDEKDLSIADNICLTTNFYFDYFQDSFLDEPNFDVYYIGSYDDRITEVIDVTKRINEFGFQLNVKIPCGKKERKKMAAFSFINSKKIKLTYEQNLLQVIQSKVVLDFAHKELHNGLSFRPFEALGFKKKLITTNHLIAATDLKTENVFVLGIDQDLKGFMDKAIVKTSNELYEKYSFTNWFNTLIN